MTLPKDAETIALKFGVPLMGVRWTKVRTIIVHYSVSQLNAGFTEWIALLLTKVYGPAPRVILTTEPYEKPWDRIELESALDSDLEFEREMCRLGQELWTKKYGGA